MSNHRSLAGAQELRAGRGNGVVAVPVTAVHGAAAAGKTNLVDALAGMRAAVLESVSGWDPYAGPVRTPHRGFPDRPSEFVADFVAEGAPYTYGFRLAQAEVAAEWLYAHPRARKRIVFERNGDQVRVGPMFEAARYGVAAVAPLVRPNALLLSLAGQLYAEALAPAYRWFESMLEVQYGPVAAEQVAHRLGAHLSKSPENAARLLVLLRASGLGIEDLLLAEPDPRYADHLRELDADIAATGAQLDLCANSPGHAERLLREHGVTEVLLDRELTNLRAARDALYARMVDRRGVGLSLVHAGVDAAFDIAEESTATLSLLRLLPTVLDALDGGKVLVVDDIGTQLPVEETDRLIQLFQNPQTNARGAQLIFTTGDRAVIDRSNGRSPRTATAVWRIRRGDGVSELTRV
ncbi:AAA family ATPase [Nocardia panacis]|uniref:AAA family ATPase n=1 Tax=Nocardia panacis TaxID=2340916 RepID=UPI001EEFD6E4|nr:ATP-binding protein [Nocardia panacis]